jgi:hypothetical protein
MEGCFYPKLLAWVNLHFRESFRFTNCIGERRSNYSTHCTLSAKGANVDLTLLSF